MPTAAKSDTYFTAQVKTLINKLYGRSILKDSLLERAISFYEFDPFNQNKLDKLQVRLKELNEHNGDEKFTKQIGGVEKEYQELKQELKQEANERHSYLSTICKEIIDLAEGDTFEESNRKSAQLLGTIQLLSPTEGKKVASANECSKALYKAVLCLRLLDRLCIDGTHIANEPHLKGYLANLESEGYMQFKKIDAEGHQSFVENVKIPIVMAALIQDIGHFHQDAQKIVRGDDGTLDPHRTLQVEDRKKLLQINFRETVRFLVEGVGAPSYIGNSKADRDRFNIVEHKKLVFIKHLIKSSIAPKLGIGNLLKVPQIYTSIILSTKSSYNYKLLPKVYNALDQNAERGTCCKLVVDALRKITGTFPQGYGVVYIPLDSDGEAGDHYEYAIVNQLYPTNVDHPRCRAATRTLTFISHGTDVEIAMEENLYNSATAKEFATLSKERLNEILIKLSSNYLERKDLDLLPRCWHAGDFFSLKDNQKLWNKS